MLVLPLVMTSLILGLAGNKRGKFNKQAGITILYYVSTTLFAAIIGTSAIETLMIIGALGLQLYTYKV